MIFVTVGTNEARFDRLLEEVGRLELDDEIVVQHGPSPVRPPRATCHEFLHFDELTDYIRRARAVVTHAGVGSVMVCLTNGKRPIVVPRLRRFNEAVDDHQLVFARRLREAGFVALVEEPAGLRQTLSAAVSCSAASVVSSSELAEELRSFVVARSGRRERSVVPARP